MSIERGQKATKTGMVISDKMKKTIIVAVERRLFHKRYQKIIKRTTTLKVHDENNTCRIGDKVLIAETKPLSKTKHWVLREIIQKAK